MQLFKNKYSVKLTLLFTLLLMFCGHAFCYTNLSFSGASVMVDAGKANASLIADGQFLTTLYWRIRGSLSAPFIVGLLSTVYLAVGALLIVDMLELSHPLSLFALCGSLALNVSVTAINAAQLHMADVYFLAFFFSVLGAWLCALHPLGFLPAAGCFAAMFGLESSMAAVGPFLVMLTVLLHILKGNHVKEQLFTLLRALVSFTVGFLLYYAAALLFCQRQGAELNASFNALTDSSLFDAYLFSIRQLFQPATTYASLCAFIFGLLTALSLLSVAVHLRHTTASGKTFSIILMLLLPLMLAMPVFSPEADISVSQRFACSMLPVAMVALLDLLCSSLMANRARIMRGITACAFGITFLSSIVFANQVYLKKNLEYQSTLSIMTRVIEMAEQTEGFDVNSTPVAIVGSIEDSALSIPHMGFEHLSVLDAVANNFTASSQDENTWYFWEIMGYPFNFVSDYERDQLACTDTVQTMPAFPEKGCCQMVENTLVIRLSE